MSACERCSYENTAEARFCLQCGAMVETVPTENQDPLIGRVLMHRYRIMSELGEGGMGKVYLAEQKMGTAVRKVAIKTLHRELNNDPQLVARFHRECETVIELHHPNTVKFFDFGELEDKTLFIVMEFIEGGDLARRLQREGPISGKLADKILIQICGSLHEAHEHGVVHRDLKPENILLTTRGGQTNFVKVLDFGIAKRSEAEDASSAKLTKQGMVLGTPPYMSPEQFSGQALDLRSDIYSLGILTYEMITGHLPFEARTPWEWATKHLTVAPTPIEHHALGAALAEPKRVAIMRALSKNRDERQANALVFMNEFTGMGDAQAAWTLATNSHLTAAQQSPSAVATQAPSAQNPSAQNPVHPVHPQSGYQTPPPAGYQTPPPMAYNPTPTPAPTDSYYAAPTSGGSAKWAILGLLAFVLMGGAAGAAWIATRPDDPVLATHDPQQVPPQQVLPQTPPPTPHVDEPTGTPIAPPIDPVPMVPVPMNPVTMEEPGMDAVTMEDVQMTSEMAAEMDTPRMTTMMRASDMSVSAGDRANAARHLQSGTQQIGGGNLQAAAGSLRQAQRILGRRHAGVRALRTGLGSRGSNQIGILLQQGNCSGAQQLYRVLNGAGAAGRSRVHFGDWCARP